MTCTEIFSGKAQRSLLPPSTMNLVLLECLSAGWKQHHTEFWEPTPHVFLEVLQLCHQYPLPVFALLLWTWKLSISSTGNRMGPGAECETNSEEVLQADTDSIFGKSFPKLKKKGFPKMTENEFATSAKSGLWVICPWKYLRKHYIQQLFSLNDSC